MTRLLTPIEAVAAMSDRIGAAVAALPEPSIAEADQAESAVSESFGKLAEFLSTGGLEALPITEVVIGGYDNPTTLLTLMNAAMQQRSTHIPIRFCSHAKKAGRPTTYVGSSNFVGCDDCLPAEVVRVGEGGFDSLCEFCQVEETFFYPLMLAFGPVRLVLQVCETCRGEMDQLLSVDGVTPPG